MFGSSRQRREQGVGSCVHSGFDRVEVIRGDGRIVAECCGRHEDRGVEEVEKHVSVFGESSEVSTCSTRVRSSLGSEVIVLFLF